MSYTVVERPTSSGRLTLVAVMAVGMVACGPPQEMPRSDKREAAIVGGTLSEQGAHPTVGAFVINFFGMYQSFCTGTLISPRFILTAGHCLKNPQIQGQPFGVFFGASVTQANESNVIPVESIHAHPNFVLTAQAPGELRDWYDIGLVKLAADAPITPMKMLRPDQAGQTYRYGADALVAGYGLTSVTNMFSSGTKYEAMMAMADVASSEVMLGGKEKGIPCQGDSGGPTFMNAASDGGDDWRLVAVTSRGDQDCTLLSIQTRVDAYLDWIHEIATDVICDSGNNGAECTPVAPPSAKKAFGAFCEAPAECLDGLCANVGEAARCTKSCDLQAPNCPAGAECIAINDTTSICVGEGWNRGGMGAACEQPEDCASDMCAQLGDRAFCTVECEIETGCGDDSISCVAAGSVNVCVPEEVDGGGCRVGRGHAPPLLALLALLALLVRRRRRS